MKAGWHLDGGTSCPRYMNNTHFRVPLLQLLGDDVERPLQEAANALADVKGVMNVKGVR